MVTVFRNGDSADYLGPRHSEGIVSTMLEMAAPPARHIPTLAALEALSAKLYGGVAPEPLVVFFAAAEADMAAASRTPLAEAFMARRSPPPR